jgi:6-pyruvoyltetrahydropterin/6-carboxytetrahydropterin synthase
MENKPFIVSVLRKSHFNAAHRLHNPEWSDEMNRKVFGVCNNPNYHGHNYDLIVKVTGPVDPKTGYVMDMKILQDLIDEHIIDRFDHKNLSLDTEEFKTLNPTAENIAVVIWNILRKQIDKTMELHVTLYETERNIVEYGGPAA